MRKAKISRVQGWLSRYLCDFQKSFKQDFENKEFSSFEEMSKAASNYIEEYKLKMTLEHAHRYNALLDYSTRIQYRVANDAVTIMNITGHTQMLRIYLE